MKASPPVQVTRRGMMAAGAVVGVGFALVLIAGVFLALRIGGLVHDNQQAIVRIHRIERPTQDQTIAAVLRALSSIRSCARSPACRKRNPGVTRVARAIPRGSIPRRVRTARRRRTSSSSGASNGGSSAPGSTNPPPARTPAAPSQTGSRPQPTVRPPAASPAPANPPASPPQSPPKPSPAPAPTPTPPPSVPAATTPPVGPVPPQTTPTVPLPPLPIPLPGVCTPVIGVNCPPNR